MKKTELRIAVNFLSGLMSLLFLIKAQPTERLSWQKSTQIKLLLFHIQIRQLFHISMWLTIKQIVNGIFSQRHLAPLSLAWSRN